MKKKAMVIAMCIMSIGAYANGGVDIISGKQSAIKKIAASFDYYSTSTYNIYSKVDYITTIKLSPDEEVSYIGGGDTKNWQIDIMRGGKDNSEYIYLKPLDSNLKTNLSILTNKRTYYFTVESTDNDYNPLISFEYPFEREIAVLKKKNTTKEEVSIKAKSVENIDFRYKISGDKELRPEQVFNDELKTVLIMPDKLQETPVVYVKGLDGELSIVNYRVISNRIIIDKLVDEVKLVLGKKTATVNKY